MIAPVIALFDHIESFGYEARLVGGVVRDMVLKKPGTPEDIDLATDMPADALFAKLQEKGVRCIPAGIKYGSMIVVIKGKPMEITTLRRDVQTDGRHAIVEYTNSWEEDSLRRDFTFNAIYCNRKGRFYDYHNGISDLQKRIVRFIGDPERRIREDYLRILRYFRFALKYGYDCHQDMPTLETIKMLSPGLQSISGERIFRELTKTDLRQGISLIMNNVFGIHSELSFKEGLSNEEILATFLAYNFSQERAESTFLSLAPSRKFKRLYTALKRYFQDGPNAISRLRPEMHLLVDKCLSCTFVELQ